MHLEMGSQLKSRPLREAREGCRIARKFVYVSFSGARRRKKYPVASISVCVKDVPTLNNY